MLVNPEVLLPHTSVAPYAMTICSISENSPHLLAVKSLWRAHSDTLGYFPDGAFNQYAANGQILGATVDGECHGYLLYRKTTDRAVIVHLCVAPIARGKGVTRALITELVNRTRHLRGIGLRCRRDFDVSGLWPRLGFMAAHDQPGRAERPTQLTFWWMDHGHPTLFTTASTPGVETSLPVVIDANVFYDIADSSRPSAPESCALQEGWIADTIELHVTAELYNEINRNPDNTARDRNRRLADAFPLKAAFQDVFHSTLHELRKVFPEGAPARLDADLRQIAHAIGCDISFFITRDEYLLSHEDDIYKTFGLTVIRPAELIVRLDELQREQAYRPSGLAGTGHKIQRLKPGKDDIMAGAFCQINSGEPREQFKRQLHIYLAQPERYECLVAYDPDGAPVVLLVHDYSVHGELSIPLLRVVQRPLGLTLLRHLIHRAMSTAVHEARHLIQVQEKFLTSSTEGALQDLYFQSDGKSYYKFCMPFVGSVDELRSKVLTFHTEDRRVSRLLMPVFEELSKTHVSDWRRIERILWPAKILDSFTPCFIIPIRAKWAQHLFDPGLASQNLFGAIPELAFSLESVYYRSGTPTGQLRAPGRILWYVSKDSRFVGSGALRACSAIDLVEIDNPKVLYKRYRRLGVYEWHNVYQVAKRDITRKIMAINFSDSETLESPISWDELQSFLISRGIRTQLQSPIEIPHELFLELYNLSQAKRNERESFRAHSSPLHSA